MVIVLAPLAVRTNMSLQGTFSAFPEEISRAFGTEKKALSERLEFTFLEVEVCKIGVVCGL